MNFHRVATLIKKELLQAYKDPSAIITAMVFPVILLFLYGFGISLDMDGIRIGVVSEDTSTIAKSFVRSLSTTHYFSTRTLPHFQEASDLLTAGKIDGIVLIPSYFSEYYLNKDQIAPIQVIADGSAPNTAQFVQNYIRGAWFNWLQERAVENASSSNAAVSVIPRVWYNQELRSHWFLIPGSIVLIMTVTGALLTSLVIAREWERGTMEALMSTPVTMQEIVLSKLIAYFIFGVAAMVLCFVVARYIYFVPFRGSYGALILSSVTYLLFALGMGLLISITVHDQFTAAQIAIVTTYLPAFILSGFIFDISSMPVYLRFITYFVPARYFVDNLKTLFLVGDVWSILLPNIFYISIFTFVIFVLIRLKSIKRLE